MPVTYATVDVDGVQTFSQLTAPDLPGFGYRATPAASDFGHPFDAYFLERFADGFGLDR